MNYVLEDIGVWNEADLLAKIDALLEADQTFICESLEDGGFHPCIFDGEKLLWDSFVADRRIALLDAFGWLWSLKRKDDPDGPWASRRRELIPQSVSDLVHGSKIPDPQDVDPKYIHSVYLALKRR